MSRVLLKSATEGTSEFSGALARLAARGESDLSAVEPLVRQILEDIRERGDAAVKDYIFRFEGRRVSQLLYTDYGGQAALDGLGSDVRAALIAAADRIRRYHERQASGLDSFEYKEGGVLLGSRVNPLDRVGIYTPGGKARYPSSVLMSAIPAQVAGVRAITLASPNPGAEVRAACHLAGVEAILDAGGAQAIATLAYGTESVPPVDKIVGPGNLYVAAAKRLVFGQVDIDSLAGPSEILVLADENSDPRLVAADLLSQAEHDEASYPLLLCLSTEFVERVATELPHQLESLPRRSMAEQAILDHGVALVVRDRQRLAEVANQIAAEHVAVHVQRPEELAREIRHAGAIFVGSTTPEAAGDYLAGPSHVLPTGGAARYGAPLGVYDFVSRSSVIAYTLEELGAQAAHITALARAEGLEGHARAVESRLAPSPRQNR
ncbi:MAG TPA: histidinol dehydrogenase [Polyangiaceae bacterium]|jgi:histidinol dehydrogenase